MKERVSAIRIPKMESKTFEAREETYEYMDKSMYALVQEIEGRGGGLPHNKT